MFAPSVSPFAMNQMARRLRFEVERERRILLKDVPTALDMTSETPRYKYVHVIPNVRVTLLLNDRYKGIRHCVCNDSQNTVI